MLAMLPVVVTVPGACLPDTADLLLVVAGDLQDIQVDVDEDGEHWEKDDAEENDDGHIVNHREEGTEAIIAWFHLQLPHHNWGQEDMRCFFNIFFIYWYAQIINQTMQKLHTF